MADPSRSLVRNAADSRQVSHAKRSERQEAERLEVALKLTMQTPAGRIVLWQLLESARVLQTIYDPNGSRLYYNAGRQDLGFEWLAKMTATRDLEDLYLTMEKEAREYLRRRDVTAAAVQQQPAEGESNG